MSKIIQFTGKTKNEIEPDVILEKAKGNVIECLVIGFQPEGKLYFAGSTGDVGQILTMIELAKKQLMDGFHYE